MPNPEFDAVVVGGGHNGLICAAYLARGGMRTAVLEARATPGGCASTVEAMGARVNICSCDHLPVRTVPLIEELDLAAHGLSYLEVEPGLISSFWDDHPPWALWRDVERTVEGLRRDYPGEVEGYRRLMRASRPVAELIIEMAQTTPGPRSLADVLRRRPLAAARLLAWSRRSARGLLGDFFSHEALIAPAVASGPVVWGLDGTEPGTGLGSLGYVLRHSVGVGRPVGGSGSLPVAVARSFRAEGGVLRCSTRAAAVLVEGGRVRGVRTVDGGGWDGSDGAGAGGAGAVTARVADAEVIATRRVVVACDPRMVALEGKGVPQGFAVEWNKPTPDGYESKIDAVISSLPAYRRLPDGVDQAQAFVPTTMILPSLRNLSENLAASAGGRVGDDPVFLVNVPSALDETMQPSGGGHVFSLESLYTPYELSGGWQGSDEPGRWLRRFAERTLGGFAESIVDWRAMTPPEYEKGFSLPKGHVAAFTGSPLAALLGRPPHLTRYTTPIGGLHMTGGATFPGAGVWGASGRNTAQVILARA